MYQHFFQCFWNILLSYGRIDRGVIMKILIVVDMQNDFVTGSLGSKAAEDIVEDVKDMVLEYKKLGYPVIFTRDTHSKNYLNKKEAEKLPVEHCIKGSYGWQIVDSLNTEGFRVVNKNTFGSKKLPNVVVQELKNWIKANGKGNGLEVLDEIVIVGLCTDICVISNAIILKSALPEINITVMDELCAGITEESHDNALNAMKMCHIDIK